MRNVIVRSGSSGQSVRDLQMALNNRLNPSPNLIVNGLFTPQTERAVLAFQRSNWLEMDGIAGPCTLDALYGTESAPIILHNVPYPQPTDANDMLGCSDGNADAAVNSGRPHDHSAAAADRRWVADQ